ncbi:FecR family protein [Odoribacter sp. AF15-53]|uniref:FecR family protein n=1 Tax=Odoribacter sp. AF15-53 TaxID=2292236 RepID=UPI000E50774E|nr:FecR domain-containing protein [Odoribacter sp. AF15-53]RHR74707.1 DUF4974 domain-containing protein [Odoribacter sp. AF15-53]
MDKNKVSWDILLKKVRRELTPDEQMELQKWLGEDERHRIYFERVRATWQADESTSSWESNLPKVMTRFDDYVEKERREHRRKIRNIYRYAACLLLVLAIGGGMLFFHQEEEQEVLEAKVSREILPGGNKAIILLADGKKVDVEWLVDSAQYKVEGVEVEKEGGKIRYVGKEQVALNYNTIMIPRGGEYQVELSDGTMVWLNSETQLRIPTTFVGKERRVYLSGEAYFAVAKNRDKPFIVETELGEVKVYGTEFNVKFYREEKKLKATLVEGNIGFRSEQIAELKIKPGYQLSLVEGANTPEIKQVKIYNEIAWKNRQFCFESERLESVMMMLQRWYNVEVDFVDPSLKDFKLSGTLNRYDKIETLLRFFEEGFDIKFLVENNTIKVMRK